jgi:hypothetical protein
VNFIVRYSPELDLQTYLLLMWKNNWVDDGNRKKENFYRWAPKEFVDNLGAAKDKKTAENIVKQYWKTTFPPSFKKDNKFIIDWFGRLLNEEKDLIIKRLEKAYKKPFPFDEITVYLTTCFGCPYYYEQRYFFIGRNYNFFGILNTARHELNHFMFHYYFEDYVKEKLVSRENIHFLKEALAILTSNKKTENEGRKAQILKIEDFVKQNKDLPIKKIIDLVIANNFFADNKS